MSYLNNYKSQNVDKGMNSLYQIFLKSFNFFKITCDRKEINELWYGSNSTAF